MLVRRRVLHLDSAGLTLWRRAGRQIECEGEFPAEEAGHAAFAAWLAEQPATLLYLIVDLVEESFASEDVPAVRGSDRRQLIQRKLAQHFFATPYVLADSLGRSPSNRHSERLLLMALQKGHFLDPWLATIAKNRGLLVGMYSAPQIIALMRPPRENETYLLISRSRAGLRQTFFLAGKLRFSRLTPLIDPHPEEAAKATPNEAEKIHQYLANQRLVERDQALSIRILAHADELAAIHRYCHDTPFLHFEFLSLEQEARRTGFAPPLVDGDCRPLLAHLLLRKTPRVQFAPAELRWPYRLWQARAALHGASLASLFAAALFAGKQGIEILARQDAIRLLQLQTTSNHRQYEAILQKLPAMPLPAAELRSLVERYAALERRAVGPTPLLVQISRSLDAFPEIALERIEWSLSGDETASEPTPPLPTAFPRGPYAQAVLHCRLPLAMARDHRQQLTLANAFIGHLLRTEGTAVQMLVPPIDTESGKTLKSSDERRAPEPPRFSLRVLQPL